MVCMSLSLRPSHHARRPVVVVRPRAMVLPLTITQKCAQADIYLRGSPSPPSRSLRSTADVCVFARREGVPQHGLERPCRAGMSKEVLTHALPHVPATRRRLSWSCSPPYVHALNGHL